MTSEYLLLSIGLAKVADTNKLKNVERQKQGIKHSECSAHTQQTDFVGQIPVQGNLWQGGPGRKSTMMEAVTIKSGSHRNCKKYLF